MAASQQLFNFVCLLSRRVSRVQSFVHQCEYLDPGNIILTYLNCATVLVQRIQCKAFSAKCLVQIPKDKVIPCFSAKYTVERIGQLVQIMILKLFSANSLYLKKISAKSAFKPKCIQCKVQDVYSLVHILENKLVQSMQCKVLSIKYEETSGFEIFQCKIIPNSLVQSIDLKICSANSLLAQKQGLVQTPSQENLLVQYPNLEMSSAKSLFLFSAISKQQYVQDNFPTMCQCNFLSLCRIQCNFRSAKWAPPDFQQSVELYEYEVYVNFYSLFSTIASQEGTFAPW